MRRETAGAVNRIVMGKMTDITFIWPLVTQIGISAIAAYCGAWFALRRFRSEKRWERKLAAYESIFESLNTLAEEAERKELRNIPPSENDSLLREAIWSNAGVAIRQIQKQMRIGGFSISAESAFALGQCLERLRGTVEAPEMGLSNMSPELAIKIAIAELTELARADLKAR